MAGRNRSTKVQQQIPSVSDIAAAVASCLEEKITGIQTTVDQLASKVNESSVAIGSLQERVNKLAETKETADSLGEGLDMTIIRADVTNALKTVAAEFKETMDKSLQSCSTSGNVSHLESSRTTAATEPVPFVTITLDGKEVPIFFPSSVREAVGSEKCERALARIVMRHYHKVVEIRNFQLKKEGGEGMDPFDEEVLDDDNGEGELIDGNQKAVFPVKTMLVIQAVILKKYPVPASLLESNPIFYAKSVTDKIKSIRNDVSRLLQYFKRYYDNNGIMKEEMRYANRKPNTPEGPAAKTRRGNSSPK